MNKCAYPSFSTAAILLVFLLLLRLYCNIHRSICFSQDVYPYFLQLKYNFSQTQLIVNVLCNTPLVWNCISLRIENFFYADNIKEFVAEINAIDNYVRSFELPNKLCLLFLLLLFLDIMFSLNYYSAWYICLIYVGVFEQKMQFNFQCNFTCNDNYKVFEAMISTKKIFY